MYQTITKKVSDIIQGTLKELGFDLVNVTLQGQKSKVLEILIDRFDDTKITIEDCKIANRNISALLDVEDVIKDKYYLQVSSAGVERPLFKFEDYVKSIGKEVKLKLTELLNNRGHYQGKIIKAKDDIIELQLKEGNISISFNLIKKAHLVLTDEMFRKLLSRPSGGELKAEKELDNKFSPDSGEFIDN